MSHFKHRPFAFWRRSVYGPTCTLEHEEWKTTLERM